MTQAIAALLQQNLQQQSAQQADSQAALRSRTLQQQVQAQELQRQQAAQQAQQEAQRKAQEEAQRKAQEEAQRKAQAEADANYITIRGVVYSKLDYDKAVSAVNQAIQGQRIGFGGEGEARAARIFDYLLENDPGLAAAAEAGSTARFRGAAEARGEEFAATTTELAAKQAGATSVGAFLASGTGGLASESVYTQLQEASVDPTLTPTQRATALRGIVSIGGVIPQSEIDLQIAKQTGQQVVGGISESAYRDIQAAASAGDRTAQEALAKVTTVIPQEQITEMKIQRSLDPRTYYGSQVGQLPVAGPTIATAQFLGAETSQFLKEAREGWQPFTEQLGEYVGKGVTTLKPAGFETTYTQPQLSGTITGQVISQDSQFINVPGGIIKSEVGGPFGAKTIKTITTGEDIGKAVGKATEFGGLFYTPVRVILGAGAGVQAGEAFQERDYLTGAIKTGEAALLLSPELSKIGGKIISKGASLERAGGVSTWNPIKGKYSEGGIFSSLERVGSKQSLKLSGLTKKELKQLITLQETSQKGLLSNAQFVKYTQLRNKAVLNLGSRGDVIGARAIRDIAPSAKSPGEAKLMRDLQKIWAKREASTKGEVLSAKAAKLWGIKGAPKGIYTSATEFQTLGVGEKLLTKSEARALADSLVNMKIYRTKSQALKEIKELTLTQATKKFSQLSSVPMPRIGAGGEVWGWDVKRLPSTKLTPTKYLTPRPQKFIGAGEGWKTKAFDLQLTAGAPVGAKGKILKPEFSLIKIPKPRTSLLDMKPKELAGLTDAQIIKLAKGKAPTTYAEILSFKPGRPSTRILKGKGGVKLKQEIFDPLQVKRSFSKVKDFKTFDIKTPQGIKKVRSYSPEFRELPGTKYVRTTPLDFSKQIVSPVKQKKLAKLYGKSLPVEEQKIFEVLIPRGKELRAGKVKLVKDGTVLYEGKSVQQADKFLRVSKGKGVGRMPIGPSYKPIKVPKVSSVKPGVPTVPKISTTPKVSIKPEPTFPGVPKVKPTITGSSVEESATQIALKKVKTPSYVGGEGGAQAASAFDMQGVMVQKMVQGEAPTLIVPRFKAPAIPRLKYAPVALGGEKIGALGRYAPGVVPLFTERQIQQKEMQGIMKGKMIQKGLMKQQMIQQPILQQEMIQQPILQQQMIQQPLMEQQMIQKQIMIQQPMMRQQMLQTQVLVSPTVRVRAGRFPRPRQAPPAIVPIKISPPIPITSGQPQRPRRPITRAPSFAPRPQAYAVEIKRKGKFQRVATGLGRETAWAVGAKKTATEAAATFRLARVAGPVKRIRRKATVLQQALFRKGAKAGTYVQKKRLRIVTPGEVRQISYAGALATKKSPGPITQRKTAGYGIPVKKKKKKTTEKKKKKRSTAKKGKKKK